MPSTSASLPSAKAWIHDYLDLGSMTSNRYLSPLERIDLIAGLDADVVLAEISGLEQLLVFILSLSAEL